MLVLVQMILLLKNMLIYFCTSTDDLIAKKYVDACTSTDVCNNENERVLMKMNHVLMKMNRVPMNHVLMKMNHVLMKMNRALMKMNCVLMNHVLMKMNRVLAMMMMMMMMMMMILVNSKILVIKY